MKKIKNADSIIKNLLASKENYVFELARPMDLNVMRPKDFHKNCEKTLYEINENVTSKSGWTSVSNCPVCKKNSFVNWFKKYGNIIRRCKECTHGYANRRAKKLSEVYGLHIEDEQQITGSLKAFQEKRKYRINRFATERVNLLKKFKKNGKLLDFGCGDGWFLEHARKYYEVAGFEPTKNLAKLTSDSVKIKVQLDSAKFQSGTFDIITSFDVIEHVPEPRETFKEYSRLLKKDGILLIYTPNADSVSFNYMREKQNLVTPPIHLHYFNKKSIEMLGKKNFSLVYFKTAGLDIGDMYAYERDHGNKEFAKFLFENYQTLQTFYDQAGFGNHLRAIFKKK